MAETDAIRGLLCHRCNIGMSFMDNDDWIRKAGEYVGKF
jgi:hypothetical protein